MKKNQNGFTLIELLTVIAIIGILSAVVLASLSASRNRGANASVKSNLSILRAQMEIYFDSSSGGNGSSYGAIGTNGNTCPVAGTVFTLDSKVNQIVTAAVSAGGNGTSRCILQPAGGPVTSYVVAVQLKANETGNISHWCVDSSGNSKGETALPALNSVICP